MPKKKTDDGNEVSSENDAVEKLNIIYVDLSTFAYWDRNPKIHDLDHLAASIRKYGFRDAPIYDKTLNAVPAGNGRGKALARMYAAQEPAPRGIEVRDGKWYVPVQVGIDARSKEEAEAFAFDHNNLTLAGDRFGLFDLAALWEDGAYEKHLSELALADTLPVSVSAADLDQLVKAMTAPDENVDDAAEPAAVPESTEPTVIETMEQIHAKYQVRDGDLWQVGAQFILCGDCRSQETWQLLMGALGGKANGAFTSPPYAEQREDQYGGVPVDQYVDWWDVLQFLVRDNLSGDGSFFVNIKPHAEDFERVLYVFDLVLAMKRRWGWNFVEEFSWVRQGMLMDPRIVKRFKNQFEPIYQFARGDYKFRPEQARHESDDTFLESPRTPSLRKIQGQGGKIFDKVKMGKGLAFPGNVVRAVSLEAAMGHPAAFPKGLPAFFIEAFSDPGDIWVDPFSGSGSTIVAAQEAKRRGGGIEMKPEYVSITLERLARLTRIEPRRVYEQTDGVQ